ncbi:MAG TPA: nitric oxide synthase oxygenase [Jatrophihabitans sp.]|nr:nitric oxide synthase oxygenase [Jatrophihabitans sp.]
MSVQPLAGTRSGPAEVEVSAAPVDSPESVIAEATRFFRLPEIAELAGPDRLATVIGEIEQTGTYWQTPEELLAGAKVAWRNHARCAGRYNWRGLKLLDMRDRTTPAEIAEGCFEHLRVSTNNGKLRSVLTIFEQQRPGHIGPRIHNPQLIRYAGYRDGDRIVGDPLHVELTEYAQSMGWQGAGTAFDVLPVFISVDDSPASMFAVPDGTVLEIPLEHPDFPWFADLGLRWHANPAISNLTLDVGGVRYPASPFSGWYVSSEIGARNLSDEARYDMLPRIAELMGLSTRRNASLWKDRALIELNRAVIHSYEKAGVYIVDHHTAAAQFITHVDREAKAGREVMTDWSWINPPLSASTTPTFHRTFPTPDFSVRPNFFKHPLLPAYQAGKDEAAGCPVSGHAAESGCPMG